jgi:hypothetical protein
MPPGSNLAMTADTADAMSVDLPCHLCGYDLRAHAQEGQAGEADGKCPECGASVAESRRLAAIPLRPLWRDSDPRWRRRMLAGTWILVLVPLMEAYNNFEWIPRLPAPPVFDFRGAIHTLDNTLLSFTGVYQPLIFCIGIVLLFSRERGRRPARFDWTRRWGVLSSYIVLLLSAAQVLVIGALVLAGIAAIFQSMPLRYQPATTRTFVELSAGYLRYGAYPSEMSGVVVVAFSSIGMLLACIPLFDALRSTAPRNPRNPRRLQRIVAILLAPVAFFALLYLSQAVRYGLGFTSVFSLAEVLRHGVYFWPPALVAPIAGPSAYAGLPAGWRPTPGDSIVEFAKWGIVVTIAVWLSIAQLAAWGHGKKAK